jgi:hypothetical protein
MSKTNDAGKVEIFCRYIIRKGKKIYPRKGKFFHFWVTPK